MLVTIDVEMADMDGFEAARQIRTFSDSYIVMLTGRGDGVWFATLMAAFLQRYVS